jgi:hypothetical protein
MGSVTDPHYVNHEPKGMPPTPPNENQFLHEDSRPDPKNPKVVLHYVTAFKKYKTPLDGLIDVALVALKQNTRNAVLTMSVRNVSAAMHKNVYYTGVLETPDMNINVHARKLYGYLVDICKELGVENQFTLDVKPEDPPALVKTPKPVPPGTVVPVSFGTSYDLPLLVIGSRGNAVSLWQRLMKMPVTGVYTEAEAEVTFKFQQRYNDANPSNRIGVDGKVGPMTWSKVPA